MPDAEAAPLSDSSPPDHPALRTIAGLAALIVMLGSASVLLGWAVDPGLLRALAPGRETMKPLGALGLLFGAAALLILLQWPQDRAAASWKRSLGLACAAVTFLIGSAALVEQGLGLDLGIDRLLFPGALSAEGPYAGRPVFPISLCLALLGLALIAMRSRLARAADLLVVFVLFLGLLVLVGYLYDAVPFYRVESQRPVPLVAAVLVVVIATGCLAARPHSPLLATVSSSRWGGMAARRLLPAAILLPLVLGLLRLGGQRLGLYETRIGLALFAMLNMAVFVALVYSSAWRLNEADAKQEAVHAALLESEESFRRLLDATPSGFLVVGEDGRIAAANATAEELFGYEAGDLPGRAVEELVPERFRGRHPVLRASFKGGGPPSFLGRGRDLVGLRRDGLEFPVEIGLSTLELRRGRFTVASVVDITERKRAADEIRSLNASLERRVEERTRQLEFERARWRGIVEGIADEVWMCDVEGRMSLLNFSRLTGLGIDAPRDAPAEELYRSLEILTAEGQPRPTEEMPLLRSLRGEVVHGEEVLRDRQTGRERQRQYSSAPMRNAAGTITGAVAIVRDVTDQKRAEEGLHRFELLATHGKDIVLFVRREDGRVLEANTAAVRAYGYTREELLALTIRELRAPETRDLTAEQMARADAGGLLFETVHRRKDGTTFPVEVSSQGATIGGVRTLISIVRDVTERRQAEQALRDSEQRLSRAQEIAHLGSWELDLVNDRLTWSDEVYRIFGLAPQEFAATYAAFLEAIHPDDRSAVDAAYSASIREGRDTYEIEHRVVRKADGEVRFVHEKCTHFRDDTGRVVRSAGMVHDITGRKRAELSLWRTASELDKRTRELNAVLSSVQEFVYMFDRDGRFAFANKRLLDLWGLTAEQAVGRTMHDLGYPEAAEKALMEAVRQVLETGQVVTNVTHYASPTGAAGSYENILAPLRAPGGEVAFVAGSSRDITERERTQSAMQELARQHRLALDSAKMGWWLYDPTTRVATYDERYCEIFEVTGSSKPNEEILERLHPDDRPGVWASVEAALDPRDPKPYSAEYRIRIPDGPTKWIEAHGIASFAGEGAERRATSLVGTVADITERRQAQAELSAALRHKEALLKEIHHRVKNNMQVVSSLLRLQSDALPDPRIREVLAESQRRVRAMALLHEQLYRSSDLARIDFGEYVVSLVSYLRRSFASAHPEVEIRVEVQGVLLEMERAMPLGLLVSELVSNSLKHAFPQEGRAEPRHVWIVARHEAPCGLTLIVGDDGVGLPEAVDLESSPTMGLKLVKSFVDQLKGRLALDRDPGTVFTVTLPGKGD